MSQSQSYPLSPFPNHDELDNQPISEYAVRHGNRIWAFNERGKLDDILTPTEVFIFDVGGILIAE